jgi:alanine racemase
MPVDRRSFLGRLALAGAAAAAGGAARALPALSADNFGLAGARARRANTWLEIDAAQFETNIAELRRIAGPAELCAVMKADAYGHGMDLLLPSVMRAGVRSIGLAANEEARIARALRYRGRLLRLRTATLEEVEDGRVHGIEELVGNRAYAERLGAYAHPRPLRVHLALNSAGMSRNGLELGSAGGREDARRILAMPHLRIAGLMTHFPVEDAQDMAMSLARFEEDLQWVLQAGRLDRKALTIHAANSFATLNVPGARLDMVRVGGALYGDTDLHYPQFQPIMTWKSRVATVNRYPAGNTVNYDRTYKLTRDSWLANIPVGYSDGYRRVFSHPNQPDEAPGRACVLVRGHRLPVIGRVTMNTIVADATDFKEEIAIGDEVVLYGKQGAERITQAELEGLSRSIGGDLYTVWGNSLPKVLARR